MLYSNLQGFNVAKKKDVSIFWMIVKFVTPIVVVLSFISGPNGKKFIDWNELLPDASTQKKVAELINVDISNLSVDDIQSTFTEKKTTVYKWKDDKGQWHFSAEKPMHLQAEQMTISNKVNTIQAPVKVDTKNSIFSSSAQPTATSKMSTMSTTTLPYGNVKRLMQDAKNLQDVADERAEMLNNL